MTDNDRDYTKNTHTHTTSSACLEDHRQQRKNRFDGHIGSGSSMATTHFIHFSLDFKSKNNKKKTKQQAILYYLIIYILQHTHKATLLAV